MDLGKTLRQALRGLAGGQGDTGAADVERCAYLAGASGAGVMLCLSRLEASDAEPSASRETGADAGLESRGLSDPRDEP